MINNWPCVLTMSAILSIARLIFQQLCHKKLDFKRFVRKDKRKLQSINHKKAWPLLEAAFLCGQIVTVDFFIRFAIGNDPKAIIDLKKQISLIAKQEPAQ